MKHKSQKIIAIVAADESNGIGKDGDLPWRLPNDLKHFKKLTMGHPIVMGRKTYESLSGPLSGRTNIVLSSNIKDNQKILCCKTPQDAITKAFCSVGGEKTFLIGGGQLYTFLWDFVDEIYLTRVETTVNADIYFPGINKKYWNCDSCVRFERDSKHLFSYRFEKWIRVYS